jgi:phage-related protein
VPRTALLGYRDLDATVPILAWLESLPGAARDKCRIRLGRLAEMGFELRRPEADYLRDGIYELRASLGGTHYRMLYFFLGRSAVVVTHGLVKERVVPPRDIDLAILRRSWVERDPSGRTAPDV